MSFRDFYSRANGLAYVLGVDQTIPVHEAMELWKHWDEDRATKKLVNMALVMAGLPARYDV